MSQFLATGLAAVVAALVAGVTGWLTARASARGAVSAAKVTSLADLEKEASTRASQVYKDAIDQLEREQAEDRAEIEALRRSETELRRQAARHERQLAQCRNTCRALARRAGAPEPDFEE